MVYTHLDPRPGSSEEILEFRRLQEKLAPLFRRFRSDHNQPHTTVIVPSLSVDPVELAKVQGVAHYEERSLFNLMLLRFPRLRLVYVTSKRINPLVVDYYLHQIRGVPAAHARRRLILLDCDDASLSPLTQKILDRPLLMDRLAKEIRDPDSAHLGAFNSTGLERTLSVQLGIPLYACDPDLNHIGSKTGSRSCFRAAGVAMAPGRDDLKQLGELVDGIADLWEENPTTRRIVVKLNESFSGEGNALLDLTKIPEAAPGEAGPKTRRAAVRELLPNLQFEGTGVEWDGYLEQFEHMGGICECWIEGDKKTSPSVQMRINPIRQVQPVSTHDQVLGGPSGQVFMGATFPAEQSIRLKIQEMGCRIGQIMADKGVIGRFAVDFITVPSRTAGEPPAIYAVEINLRQGGTTHPFNTLKFITDGRYDEETGLFHTVQGAERSYFATDALKAKEYRGTLPFDLIDQLVVGGIHFRSDETGVVFHLLGCLSEYGKLGCTAIAPSVEEAKELFRRTVRLLDRMCGRSPDEHSPMI